MEKKMRKTIKNLSPAQLGLALISLGLLLVGVVGCAAQSQVTLTPTTATDLPTNPTEIFPTDTATPMREQPSTEPAAPATVSNWETYTSPSLSYSIRYPTDMAGSDNGSYSWTLAKTPTNPEDVTRNFIYVSVIPVDFKGEDGEIYNYNKPETDILLNMQVGESKSLREDTTEGFTYIRKPDTIISGQPAMTYENTQPWEFPAGTKEIRYYLQTDMYLYLIGGYIDTTGANQSGAITEELFNEIIATLQVTLFA
jgi:hypothetical protein